MPVCVIADEAALSHLHEGQRMVFNQIITPTDEQCKRDGQLRPLITKFYLDELTPYSDSTLFVDADMVFSGLCDWQKLWDEVDGVEFTMANRGANDPHKGISEWVDPGMLKKAYGEMKQWYDLSSEWIYWRTGELSDYVFSLARQYYDHGKLLTRQFAGDKPDEPFFNLALNDLELAPHKAPWQPTYWQPAIRQVLNAMEIKRTYYAFSAGGNHLPPNQQRIYDEFVRNASTKMNMPGFDVAHKRQVLPERKHI